MSGATPSDNEENTNVEIEETALKNLEPLDSEIIEVEPLAIIPVKQMKEKSASRIALIVVSGFFILLALPFIYLFVNYPPISEVVDLIKTVAAVLSGIVGSVLGYYFRATVQE